MRYMRQEWQSYGKAWPWMGGMAFGRRFFESGEVRLAILSLLSDGPKHGYQLMKDLEERSGGLYKASAGSIYPTLQQLEDEDLISSDQQSGKRASLFRVIHGQPLVPRLHGRIGVERDVDHFPAASGEGSGSGITSS